MIMSNIVKVLGNICEIIYYKTSIPAVILIEKWNTFAKDYNRSVANVLDSKYIVDDSHKFSNEEEIYINPIIQKEKGFI
jgi:hypothetical protein